mmetsp:Transcript_19062/g.35108  ORF Transcript_19062/g.35108 Transcript_19062/m.35108 type:complete len:262 (+) Transcript_19062:173-958(+)
MVVIIAITPPGSLGFSVGPSPSGIKDTKVAVDGKATAAIIPPPRHHALSNNITLTNYMQLPVEQYVLIPMPLGSSLTRVDNNDVNFPSDSDDTKFELVVPTITFFKLSLTPVVYASVQPHENRVVISSTKCILRGSPFIEKVQLNKRFEFSITTTLTWEDALQLNLKDDKSMDCSIRAESYIDVDVDVPFPFTTIPKKVLVLTANAAMKLSLKIIQATFVDNLARDYNKWANDVEYRNYRASLSEVEEEDNLLVGAGEIAA